MTHSWRVVPLSKGQLLDVKQDDILEDGLYRKCDTYKGGGGYDQFPWIAARRFGRVGQYHRQFVVQLQGCNLDCPYCYVTREGVWGKPVRVSSLGLVEAFKRSGQKVFHLMGGAPALQMDYWPELLGYLSRYLAPMPIFHSDLMLTEQPYKPHLLETLSGFNSCTLYAINIKGTTNEEWQRNTRKEPNWELFWENWLKVQASGLNAYVTFTNCDPLGIPSFWGIAGMHGLEHHWQEDSYTIDLIKYKALPHVDNRPWGNQ